MDELLIGAMRLSIPLLFAAFGGMLCERSGIANIALEALLLVSAFSAAAITHLTGSWEVGIFAGVLSAALTGLAFGSVCVYGRGDQIVVGTGLNLLVMGLIPVVNRGLFGVTGSTPSLGLEQRFDNPFIFFVLTLVILGKLIWLFKKTRLGLRILAAGQNPLALWTQGVSYKKTRIIAVTLGAGLVGVGGVYLSLCQGSGYVRNMSGGRGFMALAALIFGGWKPLPTFLACIFFGLADAAQMLMQGQHIAGFEVPNQFVQILPFVVTLAVLAIFSSKIRAPKAINQDLE